MITSKTIFAKIQDLYKQASEASKAKDYDLALQCTAKVDVLLELLQENQQAL